MSVIQLISHFPVPALLRQTPSGNGIWEEMIFTLNPVETCDYVIVLNRVDRNRTIHCPPEHVWSIIQEPPTAHRKAWHRNPAYSFRTFTTDETRVGPHYVQDQPAIDWHVDRDYDFLCACPPPEKTRRVSCITSNLRHLKGHRQRVQFVERLRETLAFDLWGRGFQPIADKWDGLAPYRYSLAIENFSNSLYWSEKIADCFLAWTMPIYYGCTRIVDYFPPESLVSIDIHDPDVVEKIQEALDGDRWTKNLDAIAYARDLVLNRYQLFPFVADHIRRFARDESTPPSKQPVRISRRHVIADVLRDMITFSR